MDFRLTQHFADIRLDVDVLQVLMGVVVLVLVVVEVALVLVLVVVPAVPLLRRE